MLVQLGDLRGLGQQGRKANKGMDILNIQNSHVVEDSGPRPEVMHRHQHML